MDLSRYVEIDGFNGEHFFLSNMFPCLFAAYCPIFEEIRLFPSSEHFYQVNKTTNKTDAEFIFNQHNAKMTKKLVRTVPMRKDWDNVKLSVMEIAVRSKFYQNPKLAELLINTYPAKLIEGNTWGDVYWGVCKGVGDNHLGKILTDVRTDLIRLKGNHNV